MRDTSRTLLLALVAATALGCGKGSDPRRGDGGRTCGTDADCDDGIPCTVDTCGVGGLCRGTPLDERCSDGTVCDVAMGCVAAMECTTDAECDDSIECTLDSCGVGGVCGHLALAERCMAGQTCDATMGGCVAGAGCASDADCDDSIDCTLDTCSVDLTCSTMPIGSRCASGETCSPTLGCYVPRPCTTAADCQDDVFCNGAEVCMPEFGCAPPTGPRMCDDSDPCTLDSCDMGSDMCLFACDTSRPECMCPVAPPTCAGSFRLSPAFTYTCRSFLGSVVVNVDFTTVMFENVGGFLTARPASAHFSESLDSPASMPAVCPNFDVTHVVSGGCEETYRLSGTFTDADHLDGMVRISFLDVDGSCMLTDCIGRTQMFSATRM